MAWSALAGNDLRSARHGEDTCTMFVKLSPNGKTFDRGGLDSSDVGDVKTRAALETVDEVGV